MQSAATGTIGIRVRLRASHPPDEAHLPPLAESGASPQTPSHPPSTPLHHPPPVTSSQPPAENPTTTASARDGDLAIALGRIPSGLFVVTWREGGRDRGMLASWVMQAGFAPPTISIAVAPGRDLLGAIDSGTPFVVNVLADTQRNLLARFGKPATAGEEPFAGLAVHRAQCGAATVDGAAAWLECMPVSQPPDPAGDPGDHALVLARVIAAGAGGDLAPLVHLRKNGLRY